MLRKCEYIFLHMRRKEWQNLHDELRALNAEFKINLEIKQQVKNRKKKKEAELRLAYIMELAFARITTNEKAYKLLIADLSKDNDRNEDILAQLSDEVVFNSVISEYLSRVNERFQD